MTFQDAVKAAPQPVNTAYEKGKRALDKGHRGLVTCADTRRITGSVNLDETLKGQPHHAQASRWDYGLGYQPPHGGAEEAIWIEVHPAHTNEVSSVLAKLKWLRQWLGGARDLDEMTACKPASFVWIATAGVHINANSPAYRRLRAQGLRRPKKGLHLD